MTDQPRFFTPLSYEESQTYTEVLATIRHIKRNNPELGEAFILNGLVAEGDPDTADRIEDFSKTLVEVDPDFRAPFCVGTLPQPTRIVHVKSIAEIVQVANQ
jgi:hypothetical protein